MSVTLQYQLKSDNALLLYNQLTIFKKYQTRFWNLKYIYILVFYKDTFWQWDRNKKQTNRNIYWPQSKQLHWLQKYISTIYQYTNTLYTALNINSIKIEIHSPSLLVRSWLFPGSHTSWSQAPSHPGPGYWRRQSGGKMQRCRGTLQGNNNN